MSYRYLVRYLFATKKRVRTLSDSKISINIKESILEAQQPANENASYVQMRSQIENLAWESMSFDKLCSLPPKTFEAIQMEIKKDKFNVTDQQFQQYVQGNMKTSESLTPYYKKYEALFKNNHQAYDELQTSQNFYQKYMGQMYLYDLTQDKQLKSIITHFVNNLQHPSKLVTVAEPTFVKKILAMKRQLIMQGVQFATLKDKKQKKEKIKTANYVKKQIQEEKEEDEYEEILSEQNEFEEENEEELSQVEQSLKLNSIMKNLLEEMDHYQNQIQIKEILGYEHQFWVDVKHNRGKNGTEQNFIISQKQIPNPNPTLLLTSSFPQLQVKYIVRKQKRKKYSMHFCSKAELRIVINGQYSRKVKIQWKGPSNKKEEPVMDFKIIDYQNMMSGNPTIKTIFAF